MYSTVVHRLQYFIAKGNTRCTIGELVALDMGGWKPSYLKRDPILL